MTPETGIKHQVKDYLRLRGWFVFHNIAGIGSFPGLSDLVAVKDGIVLFIECKAPNGRMSDHQEKFMRTLELHGGHYVLARGYEDIEAYLYELKLVEECVEQARIF